MTRITGPRRPLIVVPTAAVLAVVGMAGCDPVINVAGANFPAWLLCLLVGAALSAICRPLLVLSRLDPYLGPGALIYWIIFFNRV